jgi:hypothetical protein
MKNTATSGPAKLLPWRIREPATDGGNIPPMPEAMIERLSDLWVEVLLADIERHPVSGIVRKAS